MWWGISMSDTGCDVDVGAVVVMSRCFENSSPQSCCCSALLGGLFSPSPGKKARTRSLVVDTFWGGRHVPGGQRQRQRGRAAFVLPWPQAPLAWHPLHEEAVSCWKKGWLGSSVKKPELECQLKWLGDQTVCRSLTLTIVTGLVVAETSILTATDTPPGRSGRTKR